MHCSEHGAGTAVFLLFIHQNLGAVSHVLGSVISLAWRGWPNQGKRRVWREQSKHCQQYTPQTSTPAKYIHVYMCVYVLLDVHSYFLHVCVIACCLTPFMPVWLNCASNMASTWSPQAMSLPSLPSYIAGEDNDHCQIVPVFMPTISHHNMPSSIPNYFPFMKYFKSLYTI